MPLRDPAVYLEDIERYAAAAQRFAGACTLDAYLADDKTRAAVERVLELCGEAMKQLFATAPAIAGRIPHARDIVGFRNILAHGYAAIDDARVFDIVATHVPGLLHAVRRELKGFADPAAHAQD